MPVKDGPIIRAMRDYLAQYSRYGARRVRIFLRRDGIVLGQDWAARIWTAVVSPKNPKKQYRSQNRQPFIATRAQPSLGV
jgi:putative transposase